MYKRFFSMVMSLVILCFCFPITSMAKGNESVWERLKEDYKTVTRRNEIVTSTNVEGISIKCKYKKNTKEYFLYLGEEEYKLDVKVEDSILWFDTFENANKSTKNVVYGQNPAVISFALFAPEVITAIEYCLVATASVVGITGVGYISSELYNAVSTSDTVTQINVSVADAAVSVSTSGTIAETEYDISYFEATLNRDGTVFIGRQLTYKDALYRLRGGYDLFAIEQAKAGFISKIASPLKKAEGPEFHNGPGERFCHYHPEGIVSYRGKRFRPHVWYV